MNPQRRYKDIVLANTETEAEHRNDLFYGNSHIDTSPDGEASCELSAVYDAKYSDDELGDA